MSFIGYSFTINVIHWDDPYPHPVFYSYSIHPVNTFIIYRIYFTPILIPMSHRFTHRKSWLTFLREFLIYNCQVLTDI